MSLYANNSRYVLHAEIIEVREASGRLVERVSRAKAPQQNLLGEHVLREGQRLDHLANYYLGDPHGYWRLCELNDALIPAQLAERELISIPTRS